LLQRIDFVDKAVVLVTAYFSPIARRLNVISPTLDKEGSQP